MKFVVQTVYLDVVASRGSCICVRPHTTQVKKLCRTSPDAWTTEDTNVAIATNEHLERMLVGLDSVTGLKGDDRAAKKQAVQVINDLCLQLDNVRSRTK